MDTVSEAFKSLLEEQIKAGAIFVIEENRLAIIATEDNVIQCSEVNNPWFSSHEIKLSQNLRYCKPDPHVDPHVVKMVEAAGIEPASENLPTELLLKAERPELHSLGKGRYV
jgi:hypothetical protein